MSLSVKKIITGITLLFVTSFIFAQTVFSSAAEKLNENFMQTRVTASTRKDDAESIKEIEAFEKENSSLISTLSEEEQLVIKSLIIMEKYNYLFNDKANWPSLKAEMTKQKDANDKYYEANQNNKLNKATYATFGNLISCWMVFSVTDVLKYGMGTKKYFEQALEIDQFYSYAYLSMAQWYYLSPKIAGGSKTTAIEYFEKSVKYAKNDCDTYYGKVLLSQALFEQKNYEKSARLLTEAELIAPCSPYIKLIQNLNKDGTSLYKYNANRSNLSEKYK